MVVKISNLSKQQTALNQTKADEVIASQYEFKTNTMVKFNKFSWDVKNCQLKCQELIERESNTAASVVNQLVPDGGGATQARHHIQTQRHNFPTHNGKQATYTFFRNRWNELDQMQVFKARTALIKSNCGLHTDGEDLGWPGQGVW